MIQRQLATRSSMNTGMRSKGYVRWLKLPIDTRTDLAVPGT